MAKEENFFERNKDALNAAGHAANAWQNARIAKRQQELAAVQAATAALQQEQNELKKKELEMLQKKQRQLKREQQKAEQEQKRKENLKVDLLSLVPRLKRLIKNVESNTYKDEFYRGKDLYEATVALFYLDNNKRVVDDINFHEYLFEIDEMAKYCTDKYKDAFESYSHYLNEQEAFVEESEHYFEAINFAVTHSEHDYIKLSKIENFLKTLKDLVKRERLMENQLHRLSFYKQVMFSNKNEFGSRFMPMPMNEEECMFYIDALESIQKENFLMDLVEETQAYIDIQKKGQVLLKRLRRAAASNYSLGSIKLRDVVKELRDINKKKINKTTADDINTYLGKYVDEIELRLRKLEDPHRLNEYPKKIENLERLFGNLTSIDGAEMADNLPDSSTNKVFNDFHLISLFVLIFATIGLIAESRIRNSVTFAILGVIVLTNIVLFYKQQAITKKNNIEKNAFLGKYNPKIFREVESSLVVVKKFENQASK